MHLKSLCLAAALAFAPTICAAIPIYADAAYSVPGSLAVGGTTTFTFEVMEGMNIADFAIIASDTNGGSDIMNASFDYFDVIGGTFDLVFSSSDILGDTGATGTALAFIPGWGPYFTGDVISFTFNDGIDDPITLGLSFQTTATAATVPLAASGAFLGMVLIGAAAGMRLSNRRAA